MQNPKQNNLNIENIINILETLTDIKGISSNEGELASYLKNYLSDICDHAFVDGSGNVIGEIKSHSKNAKTIMLEAHMDQIGLMITGIDYDGFLTFTNIGGVDERILPSAEVCVLSETNINGIIFCPKKTEKNNPKIEDLRIDTGIPREKLTQIIRVGDLAVISSDFSRLQGSVVSGGSMDNRAGIVSVIEALHRLDSNKLMYNVCIMFSVEEELGLHGVYSGVQAIQPDAAIVIDVTHGATPDIKDETGVFKLGSGAVICRGPNFHYEYTNQLLHLAKENEIPYAIEVASGPSGTDAWAIQISGRGVPSMLISIPLRYMHTNVETLDATDIDAVANLLRYALEGGILID